MAFNRQIELSIGPPGEVGTLIRDLRITFTIEKTDKESTNKANIQIYNLSKTTSLKVAKAQNTVILRAGYEDEGLKSLFFGTVSEAIDKKDGRNRILDITALDGLTSIQEKNVTISYDAGTSVQSVFNDLVSAMGLPLTNVGLFLPGQYANGFSFVGKVRDALTQVLEKDNKTWTIQNEQIVVIASGEIVERTGLLISPTTGLIDSPEALSNVDEKPTDTNIPKRYRIKTLMYPQIFPGVELRIESAIVAGSFRVESVMFSGDNWEGDFIAVAEVLAL